MLWFNIPKFFIFRTSKSYNSLPFFQSDLQKKSILFKRLCTLCSTILTVNLIPSVPILIPLSFISASVVTSFVKELHFHPMDPDMNNVNHPRHNADNRNLWQLFQLPKKENQKNPALHYDYL